jgi:hypothetical protein
VAAAVSKVGGGSFAYFGRSSCTGTGTGTRGAARLPTSMTVRLPSMTSSCGTKAISLCRSRTEPGLPFRQMVPRWGWSFPERRLRSVDLPQPEGPMRTVISSAETVPEASLKMLVPSRSLYEIPSNDSCTVSDESCTRLTTLRMPCTSCRVASVREVTPVKALTTRLRSRVVRCQRSTRTTIAFDVAHSTRRENTSTAEPARPIQSRPEGEPSDQLSRALMLRKQTSSARAKHRVAHARSAANVSVHKHSTSSRASWYGPQSGAVARAGKKSDITSSSRRALCCTELLLSGASGTVCGIRLCLADSSRLGSSSIF